MEKEVVAKTTTSSVPSKKAADCTTECSSAKESLNNPRIMAHWGH